MYREVGQFESVTDATRFRFYHQAYIFISIRIILFCLFCIGYLFSKTLSVIEVPSPFFDGTSFNC